MRWVRETVRSGGRLKRAPGLTLSQRINSLPLWARLYIHDLHTRADPRGDLARLHELIWQNKALQKLVKELKAELARRRRGQHV